jgi:hypothetical protein
MKKNFFLLLLLGNLIQVFGQADFDDSERAMFAKNKVKRQTQWQYDYVNGQPSTNGIRNATSLFDQNGNATEITNFDVKGAVRSVLTYTYDNHNNKTSYSRYSDYKKSLTYSQKIAYDGKGNKQEESGFDGSSPFNNTFIYDANGKIVQIKYRSDDVLTEIRTFIHSGKTTEMTIMNANNVILSKETTMFDNKNNVLEETKYVQNNVTQKANYSYDPSGKKIEESKQNLGNLVYRKKYTYSPQGSLLQVTEERQGVKPFVSYIYKYDSKGNLIEEKWTKDPDKDYSSKTHIYNENGLITETKSYNATYKMYVTYRYMYEFY